MRRFTAALIAICMLFSLLTVTGAGEQTEETAPPDSGTYSEGPAEETQSGEAPAVESSEAPTEEPVETAAEGPVEETTGEATEETTEGNAEGTTEGNAEGTTEAPAEEPVEEPVEEPAWEPIVYSAPYPAGSETEREIFLYLVRKLALNRAAACGILANMICESRLDPTASGDGGISYGLCQWQQERLEALRAFCEAEGLDISQLNTQLAFIGYELNGTYAHVYRYLQAVADAPWGAYDAGQYWCKHYERPTDAEAMAHARGSGASDGFWNLYGTMPIPKEAAEIPEELLRIGSSCVIWTNPLESDQSDELPSEPEAGQKEAVVCSSREELILETRKQCVARNGSFSVQIWMTQEEITDFTSWLMDAVYQQTGVPTEGDYLRWSVKHFGWSSWSFQYENGGWYCTIPFAVEFYSTAEEEQQLTAKIADVFAELEIGSLPNAYGKLRAIYDYITENVRYDTAGLQAGAAHRSAYGAMFDHLAVCHGYTVLLQRMAMEAGLPSRCLLSADGGHIWNAVCVDGKYYNCDATWDESKGTYPLKHTYFLKSDADFLAVSASQTDIRNHTRGDTAQRIVDSFGGIAAESYVYTGQEPAAASGSCGPDLRWEIGRYGTLTISGTGPMYDYGKDTNKAPWITYAPGYERIVITDGVTRIGDYAFYSQSCFRTLTLPESVTEIGKFAFYFCYRMEAIALPSHMSRIEESAFSNCLALKTVAIPEGISRIDSAAFWACKALVSVSIPASVNNIGYAAFGNCGALTTIYYPGSEVQWRQIIVDRSYPDFLSADIIFGQSGSAEAPELLSAELVNNQCIVITASAVSDGMGTLAGYTLLNAAGDARSIAAVTRLDGARYQMTFPAPLAADTYRLTFAAGTAESTLSFTISLDLKVVQVTDAYHVIIQLNEPIFGCTTTQNYFFHSLAGDPVNITEAVSAFAELGGTLPNVFRLTTDTALQNGTTYVVETRAMSLDAAGQQPCQGTIAYFTADLTPPALDDMVITNNQSIQVQVSQGVSGRLEKDSYRVKNTSGRNMPIGNVQDAADGYVMINFVDPLPAGAYELTTPEAGHSFTITLYLKVIRIEESSVIIQLNEPVYGCTDAWSYFVHKLGNSQEITAVKAESVFAELGGELPNVFRITLPEKVVLGQTYIIETRRMALDISWEHPCQGTIGYYTKEAA